MTGFTNRCSLAALGAAGWAWIGWEGILVASAFYMVFWEFVGGPLMVAFLDRRFEAGAVGTDRNIYERIRRSFDRYRRRWAWYRGSPVQAQPDPPTGTGAAVSRTTVVGTASPGITLGRSEAQQGEKRNERGRLKAVPEPDDDQEPSA